MNRADVEMLNNSLDGVGDSILKNRILQQQKDEKDAELQMRERLLAQHEEDREDRNKAFAVEKDYRKQLLDNQQAGTVSTWLQTSDGGLMQFNGRPDSLNSLMDAAAQRGQDLQQIAPPKTPAPYAQVSKETPTGRITMYARNQQELENAGNFLGKLPAADKKQAPPAAVATDNAAQDLLDQADGIEADDPDGAAQLRERAKLLRDHLKKNPPKTPFVRKTQTSTDPQGNKTTISGPIDQVNGTPAAGAAQPAIQFVRDPKTGRLVPSVPAATQPQPGQ